MKTMIIHDLAHAEELGHAELSAVRGGTNMGSQYCGPWFPMPAYCGPGSSDSSVHATQDLAQMQSAVNATANGSAYLGGIDVTNKTKQFGQNNICVG